MRFLVDANLPKFFSFFNHTGFVHVVDIDPCMSDEALWRYALEHSCTILTKDVDFYHKCSAGGPCPKVIHFQLGNMTLRELHRYFEQYWSTIVDQLATATLIRAERDQLVVLL